MTVRGVGVWAATLAGVAIAAACGSDGRATADARLRDRLKTHTVREWQKIASEGHRVGSSNAPVTLVAFVDYQCPLCRDFDLALDDLERAHPTDVAVVYRHFPLWQLHRFARAAAIAAECAGEQGRFLPFHRALYADQDSIGLSEWHHFAAMADVPDERRFALCIRDSATVSTVNRDEAVASSLSLLGTPSFLVNDSLHVGNKSSAVLEQMVARATQSAQHRKP